MKAKRFVCAFALVVALSTMILLCCGFSVTAYAETGELGLPVGSTYHYSDDGGNYTVEIIDGENCNLILTRGYETTQVTGKYNYDGEIFTLYILDAEMGSFTISGDMLIEYMEKEEISEPKPEPDIPVTFWTRLESWFNDNLLEFLSTVNLGSIAACIVTIIVGRKGNKKDAKLTAEMLNINTDSNSEVVKVANSLIEGYNTTIEKLSAMESREEQRELMYKEMQAFSKATLEILATVYANNKNIPQAVKDLVSMKYVAALKTENELKTEESPENEEV